MIAIKESDWKLLRKLAPLALERYCQRVLEQIQQSSSQQSKNFHERYLEVYSLILERNKELAWAFDDHRRSTAWLRLRAINFLELLTEEELSGFSEEMRTSLEQQRQDIAAARKAQ